MLKKCAKILLSICCLCGYAITTASNHGAEAVYKLVSKSVFPVYLVGQHYGRVHSVGSAVAVSAHELVTNCHVLKKNADIMVMVDDKQYKAQLVRGSAQRDVCLLRLPQLKLQPVTIRSSEDARIGESVYAVGNPKGSVKTITSGILSNRQQIDGANWLQTDAMISFGSSGGGLFDSQGRLLGITTALHGRFGYALPTKWVRDVMHTDRSSSTYALTDQSTLSQRGIGVPKLIGTFHQVKLYRHNRNCFMLIPGESWWGKQRGLMFWSPDEPGIVMIFPHVEKMTHLLQQVAKVSAAGIDPQFQGFTAASRLVAGKHNFPLYGIAQGNRAHPILFANVGEQLLQLMESGAELLVDFRDTFLRRGRVTYTLNGMNKALQTANAQCVFRDVKLK